MVIGECRSVRVTACHAIDDSIALHPAADPS